MQGHHIHTTYASHQGLGRVQRWVTLTYFSRSQSPNFPTFFNLPCSEQKTLCRGESLPKFFNLKQNLFFWGIPPVCLFFKNRNNTLPITSQHFDAVTIFVPHMLPTKVSDKFEDGWPWPNFQGHRVCTQIFIFLKPLAILKLCGRHFVFGLYLCNPLMDFFHIAHIQP